MLNRLWKKIESKRESKNIFWIFLVLMKDFLWHLDVASVQIYRKINFMFYGGKIAKQLAPYEAEPFDKKIRFGNLSDGGYVLPAKILPIIDVVYTYGIGKNISFEEDLIKNRGIPVRLYDHTIARLPSENKKLFFKKQGIDTKKGENFDTFKNQLTENGDKEKTILLKMDIEGKEWSVINGIIDEFSKNIAAIIIELHGFQLARNTPGHIKTLKKINSMFTIVHLHGNNNTEALKFGKKIIPYTCELTLVNNNLIKNKKVMTRDLPSKIDYPNCSGLKDIYLNFWKHV